MADITPLANGVRHSWASIRVNVLGRTIDGIVAIDYSDEQNIEDNYGAGRYPVVRGNGNIESKASITLYKYEVEALQKIAPNGRIQDIAEFDIPVVYLPEGEDTLKTDVLKNVRFTKNERNGKQGDTKLEVTIDLKISHIVWHKS